MSILPDFRYEKIHTGSAIETKRLQIILEEQGIPSILRDDNESAKLAGYALGSPDQSRLLVDKEHLVKAKHIVAATLEDFKTNALTDDELNSLSQEESQSTPIKTITRNTTEKEKPGVSPGRLIFYVLFLLYSLWRLSPLLKGEELPMLRIIISGALSIFCIYMLISYFSNKK
ncbi:putative signal transducing protein [Dokdonia donghaensis]|uniref:DUF2007 domain-containing protein n=1 Tax=Dokdonia donghaensis DSW-1 TaxID=1300343 RepID=A0A0A2GQJ7_9FLAO|nr:DUF2007 domain-containing protein [Dokdonia donghaensis]ANH61236.1 hypothetical protein I597_2338 [Dokdonia donghaensis DSW-1]KGO05564.1 hypothetical protein NV36_01005 [Dokdonia donghaensis DSW-1]